MVTPTTRTSAYRQRITNVITHAGLGHLDPRHVEAWMRCEHGTLGHLDPTAFDAEALVAAECVTQSPTVLSETLARSYGL